MIDPDFAAYVEGLPPQDRRTVEQALQGLRTVMDRAPPAEKDPTGREGVRELLVALREITRRKRAKRVAPTGQLAAL